MKANKFDLKSISATDLQNIVGGQHDGCTGGGVQLVRIGRVDLGNGVIGEKRTYAKWESDSRVNDIVELHNLTYEESEWYTVY